MLETPGSSHHIHESGHSEEERRMLSWCRNWVRHRERHREAELGFGLTGTGQPKLVFLEDYIIYYEGRASVVLRVENFLPFLSGYRSTDTSYQSTVDPASATESAANSAVRASLDPVFIGVALPAGIPECGLWHILCWIPCFGG